MVDLKSCPFCGEAPRFIDDTGYGDSQVFCPNEYNGCPAPCSQSTANEPEKAIAAWNRRPVPEDGKRVWVHKDWHEKRVSVAAFIIEPPLPDRSEFIEARLIPKAEGPASKDRHQANE